MIGIVSCSCHLIHVFNKVSSFVMGINRSLGIGSVGMWSVSILILEVSILISEASILKRK